MRKLFFLFIASLLINLSKAQNVGIGTTTPAKPLDVALPGGIQISRTENASSSNEIFFSDNGQIRSLDSFHRIVFNRFNDQLEFRELGKILLYTGNPLAEAMRITNNGYIGIGTSLPLSPNNLLSVAGGITIDYNNQNNGTIANVLSFGSSGGEGIGSARLSFPLPVNSHGLDFYTNYTKRLSIDAGGNVGIGTATPGAKLDVEGDVKIHDGSQGAGKVLTSDVDGVAYWNGVVACSAGNSGGPFSSDTINSGSIQTVVFKHEIYDIGGNNYDPNTGNFTAPVNGIYNCSAAVLLDKITGTSGYIYLRIDRNNSYLTSSMTNFPQPTGGSEVGLFLSMDVQMNAGDNVHFTINNSSGSRFLVIYGNGDTHMSVHLVK